MHLAWTTDIHLDHAIELAVDVGKRFAFEAPETEALLITGDISNAGDRHASTLRQHLIELQAGWGKPVYFVLGNHDLYGSRFVDVHRAITDLCAEESSLVWLRRSGVVALSATTALVGHDGFYDAGYGDPYAGVSLTDNAVIEDFRGLHVARRVELLRGMGHRHAVEARETLRLALARFAHVVFATHVPPFPETCLFRGERTAPAYLPWYSNRALGEMLLAEACAHEGKRITVLAGHTHGAAEATIGTITAMVGGATYLAPQIVRVFDW